jgi:type IV pilus assembly protein PilM
VGIDIGARAIKLLQLREHSNGLRVVGAGLVNRDEAGTDESGEGTLVEQLRGAFAAGGFTGRRCVVCLPRNEIRMQSVRLPRMPDDELRQAAVWEASQRFGLDRNAMEVDVIRTGAELQGAENREEILLIAAPHEAINAGLQPVMAAGLRPVALETHFTALARTFTGMDPVNPAQQRVRVVVDVGASGSTVLITRNNQIAFCKPIDIGGDQFDRAVAEHLQIDIMAARELRAVRMAAATGHDVAPALNDPSIQRAEYDAVRPLLGNFANEVVLCIRYYGVTFRGHPPEQLILTGGDGLEPRLGETLAAQCKIPVAYDDQRSSLDSIADGIRRVLQRPTGPPAWWAVAAGLSLRKLSLSRIRRAGAEARAVAA